MKISINTDILEREGFSLKEMAALLFYLTRDGTTFEEATESLWEKGLLTKDTDGFTVNRVKYNDLEHLMATISAPKNIEERAESLAPRLRAVFPKGKKDGTTSYWKDSDAIITKKLLVFFKKFGSNYDDDDMVKAAENYVRAFNGDYKFMQLLKYFIWKKDPVTGEWRSELASYLDNQGDTEQHTDDWMTELK